MQFGLDILLIYMPDIYALRGCGEHFSIIGMQSAPSPVYDGMGSGSALGLGLNILNKEVKYP